jgi:MFS family permease
MTANNQSSFRGFVDTFVQLGRLPGGFWYVIGAFVLDTTAYFGVLTLMTSYLNRDLGWSEAHASITVSIFTMLVTLCMLGIGSWAEGYGLRRAIIAGLLLSLTGRVAYCAAGGAGGGQGMAVLLVLGGLLLVACGSGILQPVCYSGVKQFTDEKTSSMGYALIYAIMNLGLVGIGALSSWIRPAVQEIHDQKLSGQHFGEPILRWLAAVSGSGIQAVNLVCVLLTLLTLLLFLVLMTPKAEAARARPDIMPKTEGEKLSLSLRLRRYFAEGPFSNMRFLFFIFMLLPVRTLFAHQWLTMPEYILRAYDKPVADKMEWLVNWINPMIIFIFVPLFTALTRRVNIYKMMVLGSFVSAAPTFLLCFGPDLKLVLIYFVVFSLGEALWSARFLEYASELAPPGRVAQFMGMAQIPWLLAKGTTGLYSGYLLAHYVPQNLPPEQQTTTGALWFIYGCIAMTSPIGLWLARKWVMAGLRATSAKS